LLENISKRNHNEYAFHAGIHGIKIPTISERTEEPSKLTPEETAKTKHAVDSLLKMKKAKHGR